MSWWSRLTGAVARRAGGTVTALDMANAMPPGLPLLPAPTVTATLDDDQAVPRIRREPPIQIAPDFKTVQDCKDVITVLDFGQFQLATWLIEQMLWNSRVRGVFETRLNGLVGTEIRWEPARANDLARRAARDIVEDWPLIANAATRKQLSKWGLILGVGFAQKHWYESPSSGRMIPRLETFHPQWSLWDWSLRAYRIFTLDGWALVPSPALMVPGVPWEPSIPNGTQVVPDSLRRWVVHEPFGQHSWREGLIHALWLSWLGHNNANRDMSRSSEKLGVGIVKIKYPKSSDATNQTPTGLKALMTAFRNLGREGVIPLEQYRQSDETPGYDAEPFEWSGNGFEIIRGTKESNATDMAVLVLGHNTTAETKGASVGASAQVGNLIRGDIRVGDCYNEWSTIYGQVIRDWAEVNYGDAAVAPLPNYVTDPPEANQQAAQTVFTLAQAVQVFRTQAPGVDVTELLNRFRVPMEAGGAGDAIQPTPKSPPSGSAQVPPPGGPQKAAA